MDEQIRQREDLLQQAISIFGESKQFGMAIEECGELIVAVSHYQRLRPGRRAVLLGEIADVRIMMAQLELILAARVEVDLLITEKLERLALRLKEYG